MESYELIKQVGSGAFAACFAGRSVEDGAFFELENRTNIIGSMVNIRFNGSGEKV